MTKILIIILIAIALIMIYLGLNSRINPPIFTGIGFIIIAALFLLKKEK